MSGICRKVIKKEINDSTYELIANCRFNSTLFREKVFIKILKPTIKPLLTSLQYSTRIYCNKEIVESYFYRTGLCVSPVTVLQLSEHILA